MGVVEVDYPVGFVDSSYCMGIGWDFGLENCRHHSCQNLGHQDRYSAHPVVRPLLKNKINKKLVKIRNDKKNS